MKHYLNEYSIHRWAFAFVACASCFLIIAKSLLLDTGYLSPDSTGYLELATNLVSGEGFQVTNSGRLTAQTVHFATWPIGYPSMIAALAVMLDISPFFASKILNMLLFVGCMGIIYKVFERNGAILALIMGFGSTIEIFSYTWSEAPFIFFLIGFTSLTVKALSQSKRLSYFDICFFLILGLCLFLTRYIGAFSVGIVVAVSGYKFFIGRKNEAFKLLSVAFTMAVFIVVYLAYNAIETGFSTGMPRIPAPETHLQLVKNLTRAVMSEMVFPLHSWNPLSWKHNMYVTLQIALFFAFICKSLKSFGQQSMLDQRHLASFVFVSIGLVYLIAITFMRWNSQFDGFSYRLIGPGMILAFLGGFNFLLTIDSERKGYIFVFLFSMALLAFTAHAYPTIFNRSALNYHEATLDRIERYKSVPAGSILVFGDIHVNYLRPDLYVAYPYCRPYSSVDEPWSEFVANLDKSHRIYVDMSSRTLIPNRYHKTVRAFISHHTTGDLFELSRELS